MLYQNRFYSIVVCLIFLIMAGSQAWSQEKSQNEYWGFGITPQYDIPAFKFNDRFAGGPNLGLRFSYVKNEITYEIICFYSIFSHGKIEDETFLWNIDGQYHTSPEASSKYMSGGMLGILKKPFRRKIGPLSPYWSTGAGFVYFKHQINDLIFPGQTILPIDPTFTFSPEEEIQTAFNINFGGGFRYSITQQLKADLNLRYNFLFAYLRPMEAWLLEKVSPMQSLGIGIDLTYYFTK